MNAGRRSPIIVLDAVKVAEQPVDLCSEREPIPPSRKVAPNGRPRRQARRTRPQRGGRRGHLLGLTQTQPRTLRPLRTGIRAAHLRRSSGHRPCLPDNDLATSRYPWPTRRAAICGICSAFSQPVEAFCSAPTRGALHCPTDAGLLRSPDVPPSPARRPPRAPACAHVAVADHLETQDVYRHARHRKAHPSVVADSPHPTSYRRNGTTAPAAALDPSSPAASITRHALDRRQRLRSHRTGAHSPPPIHA
jgi:hypothetical protein